MVAGKKTPPRKSAPEWRRALCDAWDKAADKKAFVDCAPAAIRLDQRHIDRVAKGESFDVVVPCCSRGMAIEENRQLRIVRLDSDSCQWYTETCGWLNLAWVCGEELEAYLAAVAKGDKQAYNCGDMFSKLADKIRKHDEKGDRAKKTRYAVKFKQAMGRHKEKFEEWKRDSRASYEAVKEMLSSRPPRCR